MSYKMLHPEKCGILRCTGKTIRQGKLYIIKMILCYNNQNFNSKGNCRLSGNTIMISSF